MSEAAEPVQLPVRTCTYKSADGAVCLAAGIWIPVLLLYPSVLHGPSKPIAIAVKHLLCTEHKDDTRVKDIARDSDYEMAEKICANSGWPWPDRSRTRIKFIQYAGSQLEKRDTQELAQQLAQKN